LDITIWRRRCHQELKAFLSCTSIPLIMEDWISRNVTAHLELFSYCISALSLLEGHMVSVSLGMSCLTGKGSQLE
jgi:hypothetical protein